MTALFDKPTLEYYERNLPDYAASGRGGTNRFLEQFLGKVRPGGRILELGCGVGRDANAMIAAGFDLDATDGSSAVAAAASRRIGRTVRVLRFDQLDAQSEYDAVWCSASLLHVPFQSLPTILGLIYRALKPGGLHFASFKSAGGKGFDVDERYCNYPEEFELWQTYESAGPWTSIQIQQYIGGGYAVWPGPWTAVWLLK